MNDWGFSIAAAEQRQQWWRQPMRAQVIERGGENRTKRVAGCRWYVAPPHRTESIAGATV